MHTHSSCSSFKMAGILVADGGRGLTSGLAAQKNCRCALIRSTPSSHVCPSLLHLPLISNSWSSVSGSPFIGSVPFSWMYLTINLRSNTLFETGERTGSSGISLQTKNVRKRYRMLIRGLLFKKEKWSNLLEQMSAIFTAAHARGCGFCRSHSNILIPLPLVKSTKYSFNHAHFYKKTTCRQEKQSVSSVCVKNGEHLYFMIFCTYRYFCY